MSAALPSATPSPRAPEPAAADTVVEITDLRHRYGERIALAGVSLSVRRGELFALLGPNGGGKTTLFRILSTAMAPQEGRVRVLGCDLPAAGHEVRRRLGIVFQTPALDGKLTVAENLFHHGRLYGMDGTAIRERTARLLDRFGVADRAGDRVETLSGGLARRVELARALLHDPELLVLDEPTTGLDPGARREFADHLRSLRDRDRVTILLTTHVLEEADRADRVGVVHGGSLVALGTPGELKRSVGGDVVVVESDDPGALRPRLESRLGITARLVDHQLRIERSRGHELVRELVDAFPEEVRSVTFGRPTLEDVFIHLTGQRLQDGGSGT